MPVNSNYRAILSLSMMMFLGVGCSDILKQRLPGILSVTAVTSGAAVDFDADGYLLTIDGTRKRFLVPNTTVNLVDLSIGTHGLLLEALAPNCSLTDANQQQIEVTEGATTVAEFHIKCAGNFGSIRVITETVGADQDLDGYSIFGLGLTPAPQPSNGSQVISNVRAGGTEVNIANVAANCVVDHESKFVNVTFAATTDVRFSINCVQSGSLRITTSTTGEDISPTGYKVGLRAGGSSNSIFVSIAPTGTATVSPLLPGSYFVTLNEVPANCRASTPTIDAVNVQGGVEAQTTLEILCATATQIAYSSGFDNDAALFLVKSNGTGEVRLTTQSVDHDPAWSHDGNRIAFTSSRTGDPEIYVMDADGANPVRLTITEGVNYAPAWSPDGSRIAFASTRTGNAEIYTMKADGSDTVRLTNNSAYDSNPAWSPDGKKIAFESNRDGSTAIWVMNPDGTAPIRITTNSREDLRPDWSPDGTRIAFSRGGSSNTRDIFIVNPDGTGVTQITNGQVEAYDPSWSPDGRYIVFGALSSLCSYYYYYDPCTPVLLITSLDGVVVTLPSRFPASQPVWRP